MPGDIAYEDECRLFNLLRVLAPAVVVGVTSTDDVAAAVRYASGRRMTVAVRNQGHQVVLPRQDDTLLISTRRLREVTADAERHTVRVGAGATWSDVLARPNISGSPRWSARHRTSVSSATRWAAG
ncbi:FAD-binding protein [Streptomyces sp. HC307]|uniref:FAD-binding protein n=1 Tax=Streptomyces flavusporus TaxID=3385496 RepID=UPI003916FED6